MAAGPVRPSTPTRQMADLLRRVFRLERAILNVGGGAQVWISTTAPSDTDAYPLWYDPDDTC